MRRIPTLTALATLGALALIGWLAFGPTCEELLKQAHSAQATFAGHYARRPLTVICGFFCTFTLCAALALPGASLLLLMAGASFGLFWGTALTLLASTLGATLSMLAARHLLRHRVETRFGDRLAEINAGLARDGGLYLFGLRMAPVIPFVLINPLLGLTTIRTSTFFTASALGMLASTAAYVNAGQALAEAGTSGTLLSPQLLAALGLLGVLPLLAKRLWQVFRRRGRGRDRPQ